MQSAVTLCRHCRRDRSLFARGLCRACHATPAVRESYLSTRGSRCGIPHPDAVPDCYGGYALPGTPQKVAVLAERCRRRVSLWHPLDAALPQSYLD